MFGHGADKSAAMTAVEQGSLRPIRAVGEKGHQEGGELARREGSVAGARSALSQGIECRLEHGSRRRS